ncbi:MAG: glycosyltransferase family 9 protein [Muribaculaceae bacterium]|nr:glycosyltransferase family 9 protein [Muribaculaceae bacterium]
MTLKSGSVVLATRFSALGDVAMTVPALYDACIASPDVQVVMLTRDFMAPLFLETPPNLTVVGVNLDDYKGPLGMWRLLGEMSATYGVTHYVDLHDVLRTKMLRTFCRLKGIPTAKINKGRKEKHSLTRKDDKVLLPLTHSIERYRRALADIGMCAKEGAFKGYFATTPPAEAIYASIAGPKEPGERWIGIAPFAKHEGKIYPIELMEQVIRALSESHSTRLFLFGGGPYENKILSEWARKYPATISLAGQRHGFPVELAIMSRMDAMLTMDSANMHLAALTGVPVVSVWGATHPYCGFSGWQVPDENNVQLPLPCRPCSVFGNKPCATADYKCLRAIRPQSIVDRIDAVIAQKKS